MSTTTEKFEPIGVTEVAEMAGVTRGHINTWITRGYMPPPEARLACGSIWKASTIRRWIKQGMPHQ